MGRIYVDLCLEMKIDVVAVVTSNDGLKKALLDHRDAAVIIASPGHVHAEQVELVMSEQPAMSRRILCEKPLALSHASALAVNSRIHVSGFQRRKDESFKNAFEQLSSIGQLQLIRVVSRDPPSSSERSLQSLIWDSLIHDVDLCCWFAQSRPVECVSRFAKPSALGTTVKFENGVVALCVYNQGISYGYDQRLELHGTKGSIFVSNPLPAATVLASSERRLVAHPLFSGYATRYRDAYRAELLDLFKERCVADHSPAHWCCEQALQSISEPRIDTMAAVSVDAAPVATLSHIAKTGARVCLVGCGRMGALRASLIAANPRLQLVAVVDVRESVARDLAKQLGCRAATQLSPELLNECDGVWIASSTAEHLVLIEEAAPHCTAIAVEKPVSLISDEIKRAFAAAPDRLMVAFQRFFDKEFSEVLVIGGKTKKKCCCC